MMQDRQRECRGLAGAGLRNADDIAAGEDNRNGLRLDGRRRDVFFLGQGARDRCAEAEIMKGAQSLDFLLREKERPRAIARRARIADVRDTPA